MEQLDRAQRRAATIVLKTTDSDAEKNLKWIPLHMRQTDKRINKFKKQESTLRELDHQRARITYFQS